MVIAEPVHIDRELCTSCGNCINICPDRVLRADSLGQAAYQGERCMLCGHCYAVCPVHAVTIPALTTDLGLSTIALTETDNPRERAVAELVHLMERRRSCRAYTSEPVPRERLEDLARIGVTAPSGTNCQGLHFLILPKRRDVLMFGASVARFYRQLNNRAAQPLWRLASRLFTADALGAYYRRYYSSVRTALTEWEEQHIDRLFHGAPAAIIVAADLKASCPTEDALLATQNILLAAHALGLGTCCIGFAVEAAARDTHIPKLLGLGSDEKIFSVIACGYPAVLFQRPAGRKRIKASIVEIGGQKKLVDQVQGSIYE